MNLGFDFLGGFLTLGSRGLRGFQNFRDSVIDIFFGSDFFPLSLPVFLIWGDTFFFRGYPRNFEDWNLPNFIFFLSGFSIFVDQAMKIGRSLLMREFSF